MSSVRPRLVRALGTFVVLALLVAAPRAQSFDPMRHLPDGAVAVVDCAGLDAWAGLLGDSWAGRWFAHPRTQAALSGLKGALGRTAVRVGAAAWVATGLDPSLLRAQLGGRMTFALYDVDGHKGPVLALVLDTRGHGAALFDAVRNLFALRGDEPGAVDGVPGSLRIDGPEGSSLEAGLFGDALVLAVNGVLAQISQRFTADDGHASLGGSPLGQHLAQQSVGARPALGVALDAAAIVDRLRAGPGATNPDMLRFLDVSGVGRIGYAGASFGSAAGGGLEQRFVLSVDEPAPPTSDVLDAVLSGLSHPVDAADLRDMLAQLPADATTLGAVRFDPADLLRRVESVLRAQLPESRDDIDQLWQQVSQGLGLTREQILGLPGVTLVSASTEPASGGLLPDSISIVRDAELDPWWSLFERVMAVAEVSFSDRDLSGFSVRSVDWAATLGNGSLVEQFVATEMGGMSAADDIDRGVGLVTSAFAAPVQDIARARLGDGLSLVSMLPQSIERHLRARAGERLVGTDLAALAGERLPGHVSAAVMDGESLVPAIYDTLLGLSGALSPFLGAAGIDAALLPPSELVAASPSTWHWMAFDATPRQVAISGTGPVATPLVLMAAAGAVMLWGAAGSEVVESNLFFADVELHKERMQRLHAGLVELARASGGAFPVGKGLEGLQALIDAAPPGTWVADDFVSPLGSEWPTYDERDGRPRIDPQSCSWRLVPWACRLGDTGLLLFDAKPMHDGSRYALDVDGTLTLTPEWEFVERLKTERASQFR